MSRYAAIETICLYLPWMQGTAHQPDGLLCRPRWSGLRGLLLRPMRQQPQNSTRPDERSRPMIYFIHHPQGNAPVELRGGGSKDVIACRFDCALLDMIELAGKIRVDRLKRFGLETGDLYITENGRTVLHISKGVNHG